MAAMAAPTHRHSRLGRAVGHAQLFKGHRGVVDVLNAAARLVAHHGVRWDDRRFHFVLKPGLYKFELKDARPSQGTCPAVGVEKARVQANRTTHIALSEACGSY